jgi:hypothetical protein
MGCKIVIELLLLEDRFGKICLNPGYLRGDSLPSQMFLFEIGPQESCLFASLTQIAVERADLLQDRKEFLKLFSQNSQLSGEAIVLFLLVLFRLFELRQFFPE